LTACLLTISQLSKGKITLWCYLIWIWYEYAYPAIAWISWVPNLMIVELLFNRVYMPARLNPAKL